MGDPTIKNKNSKDNSDRRFQGNSYASDWWVAWVESPSSWPSCIHVLCRVAFQILPSGWSIYFCPWFWSCDLFGPWWELWWASTNPTLENACIFPFSLLDLYFLPEVLPNLLEEKRPWVMPSNSQLPSLCPGRAAVNYGCLKEPRWDQEDHAAEFRPKSNLQNCELNIWLLFLTTKYQDDSVCRNSELIHRLRE